MHKNWLRSNMLPLLLILPAFTLIAAFVVYPLLNAIDLSFRSLLLYRPTTHPAFIGFENYLRLFKDPDFWNALKNTILFTGIVVLVQMTLGFGLAMFLSSEKGGIGRALIRTAFILPMMFTPVVTGILWRMLFDPEYGLVNFFVKFFGGTPQNWLGSHATALVSIMISDIWQNTPFVMLILLAGLQSLSKEPFEAAEIDGASRLQSLIYITLPILKPMILVVLSFRTIDAFRVFDKVFTLTMGGPGVSSETLTFYAYRTAFRAFDIGYASTICVIICVCLILVNLLYVRLLGREHS